ncbi:hypothetical protein AAX26_01328 [Aliarcobacter thereius]|uniref:DUF423 domain-containing protein n=2 Tax=Aliarcobacter thereius TaxID=544718 RepID=A0A1C0B6R7_9BACT|nr:DUF423 domain-containing protein [Aliarcobacter thereius]OCL87020.1 hypothetical protein AAX26_01328 [Aliarcobacter thereius]OCL91203.1 hypothetical protein AAX25_01373 [Aliarcobacter thereius]OCL95946.1 hypothetical protein AA347_01435 [Aliarcobacter thereius LMG 24486]OCL99271.1 hypothetical protein AAX29_01083 [Aliarcobacter thereius]QBF16082.1 hypothetical membrane protein (DUF423 domain) [Aliarcobacter thereius LMG 24486]
MIYDKRARNFLAISSLMMASAIILGAFGAHGLKRIISPEMLVVFHTGVEYQFYNTFGLFFVTFLSMIRPNNNKLKVVQYLILIGTFIFSFSLYFLTILNMPVLGAITPIGGTLQIIAYFLLTYTILKDNK